MIHIICNSHFFAEKEYACTVLVKEVLEQEFTIEINEEVQGYIFRLPNGKKIFFEDYFFTHCKASYLQESLLPQPVTFLNLPDNADDIPVLYGVPKYEVTKEYIDCKVDIVSSAFFMLSRWEECLGYPTDIHERFQFENSYACKNGIHTLPVVNMYGELLLNFSKLLGFELSINRGFSKTITHDVDYFNKWNSVVDMGITILGDLLKRHSLKTAIKNIKKAFTAVDPYDTFYNLMDLSDAYGYTSIFYFLNTTENRKVIQSTKGQLRLKDIRSRGHKFGLHVDNYKESEAVQIKYDKEYFESEMKTKLTMSRQHYLRFQNPFTFRVLEDAGLTQDSSLYYREAMGFRTGCCTEHSVFDVLERKQLTIKELPLICMDVSLLDYETVSKAEDALLELLSTTQRYRGNFVVLWHNSSFDNYLWQKYIDLYKLILRYK